LRLQLFSVRVVELFCGDELERIVRMPSLRSCLNRAASLFEHCVRAAAVPAIPPPPLIAAGDAGLQQGQRLLQLEQQLARILERLSRLEQVGITSATPIQAGPQMAATGDAAITALGPSLPPPLPQSDLADASWICRCPWLWLCWSAASPLTGW